MINSPANRVNESLPADTPGIGVAGVVMCPYGFQKTACVKGGCEMWVELMYGEQKVGRCALSWNAILQAETRQEISKLREDIKSMGKIQKNA